MTQDTKPNLEPLSENGPVRFRLPNDDEWYVGEVGHEVRGYYARKREGDEYGVRFWADEIAEIEAI